MENLKHYFEVQHGLTFTDAEFNKILKHARKDIEAKKTRFIDRLLNYFRKKQKIDMKRYSKLEREFS
jgi:hypothetical protein